MAFSIEIKTEDTNISELLKYKIRSAFSDAFVIGRDDNASDEIRKMSEFTVTLYDDRDLLEGASGDIPLFTAKKDGFRYIDCKTLIPKISEFVDRKRASGEYKPIKGRSHILLPFTYIEDREAMIAEYFSSLLNEADYVIRLDLMSGLRMPTPLKTGPETGSLTALLNAAKDDSFQDIELLEYCNPDLSGFLTPGRPLDPDDVFDSDITTLIRLLDALRKMSIPGLDPDNAALTVIEGFRLSELRQMVTHCDTVHILLPSMTAEGSSGLSDVPEIIKRQIRADQDLMIHYSNDYKRGMTNDRYRVRS